MENRAEEYYQKGNTEYENKNYDLALGYYGLAIISDKKFYKAYCKIGLIFFEKRMLWKAIENFKSVIKIKPDYAKAYYHIAEVYNNLEKNETEAEKYYLKVIELTQDNDDLKNKARIKSFLIKFNKSIKTTKDVPVHITRRRVYTKKVVKPNVFFIKMSVINQYENDIIHNALFLRIILPHIKPVVTEEEYNFTV